MVMDEDENSLRPRTRRPRHRFFMEGRPSPPGCHEVSLPPPPRHLARRRRKRTTHPGAGAANATRLVFTWTAAAYLLTMARLNVKVVREDERRNQRVTDERFLANMPLLASP